MSCGEGDLVEGGESPTSWYFPLVGYHTHFDRLCCRYDSDKWPSGWFSRSLVCQSSILLAFTPSLTFYKFVKLA